jgi:hypothetical protein
MASAKPSYRPVHYETRLADMNIESELCEDEDPVDQIIEGVSSANKRDNGFCLVYRDNRNKKVDIIRKSVSPAKASLSKFQEEKIIYEQYRSEAHRPF